MQTEVKRRGSKGQNITWSRSALWQASGSPHGAFTGLLFFLFFLFFLAVTVLGIWGYDTLNWTAVVFCSFSFRSRMPMTCWSHHWKSFVRSRLELLRYICSLSLTVNIYYHNQFASLDFLTLKKLEQYWKHQTVEASAGFRSFTTLSSLVF